LQYKGEGKGGSLGVLVGPSRGTPVKAMNTGREEVYAKDVVVKKKKTEAPDWTTSIPIALPKYATDGEIMKACFDNGNYYKVDFWDGSDIWSLDRGAHVLWKKALVGPRGGPSTKQEFFHGMVHGWRRTSSDWEIIVS
jgi:hypothetical protein